MIQGIDVSDFQNTIDWVKVAAGPTEFAYAQATYGCKGDYWDSTFKTNHDGARAAGLPFGAYCFFLFSQDPVAQAQAFLVETKDRLGTLLPMVDVESDSGTTGTLAGNIAALAAFNRVVEAAVGKPIIIYTGYYFWNETMGGTDAFAGHPVWVAAYGGKTAPVPNGFPKATLWQYSSGGIVDGVPGFVDMDYFLGDSLTEITR